MVSSFSCHALLLFFPLDQTFQVDSPVCFHVKFNLKGSSTKKYSLHFYQYKHDRLHSLKKNLQKHMIASLTEDHSHQSFGNADFLFFYQFFCPLTFEFSHAILCSHAHYGFFTWLFSNCPFLP